MNHHEQRDFLIRVQNRNRVYQYRLVRERISEAEEQFRIENARRTIVISLRYALQRRQGILTKKPVFAYDESEVTNKILMKKIIEGIKAHMEC